MRDCNTWKLLHPIVPVLDMHPIVPVLDTKTAQASPKPTKNCPKLFQVFGEGKVNQAVKASEVSDVVKRWATRLKRDKSKYSAVSLRRASTSIAAAQGVCKKIRQRHGGWKSSRMPDVYTEVSKANEKAVSKAIHKAMQKSKKNRHKKVHFEFKT